VVGKKSGEFAQQRFLHKYLFACVCGHGLQNRANERKIFISYPSDRGFRSW